MASFKLTPVLLSARPSKNLWRMKHSHKILLPLAALGLSFGLFLSSYGALLALPWATTCLCTPNCSETTMQASRPKQVTRSALTSCDFHLLPFFISCLVGWTLFNVANHGGRTSIALSISCHFDSASVV